MISFSGQGYDLLSFSWQGYWIGYHIIKKRILKKSGFVHLLQHHAPYRPRKSPYCTQVNCHYFEEIYTFVLSITLPPILQQQS